MGLHSQLFVGLEFCDIEYRRAIQSTKKNGHITKMSNNKYLVRMSRQNGVNECNF